MRCVIELGDLSNVCGSFFGFPTGVHMFIGQQLLTKLTLICFAKRNVPVAFADGAIRMVEGGERVALPALMRESNLVFGQCTLPLLLELNPPGQPWVCMPAWHVHNGHPLSIDHPTAEG